MSNSMDNRNPPWAPSRLLYLEPVELGVLVLGVGLILVVLLQLACSRCSRLAR